MSRYDGAPVCPVCGKRDPYEVYIKDSKAVGCDQCVTKVELSEADPGCPVCEYLCETLYMQGDEVLGCDQCIDPAEPYAVDECCPAWVADYRAPARAVGVPAWPADDEGEEW